MANPGAAWWADDACSAPGPRSVPEDRSACGAGAGLPVPRLGRVRALGLSRPLRCFPAARTRLASGWRPRLAGGLRHGLGCGWRYGLVGG